MEYKNNANNVSSSYNTNIDPDINSLYAPKTNASYFSIEQLANIIHERNCLSIMH